MVKKDAYISLRGNALDPKSAASYDTNQNVSVAVFCTKQYKKVWQAM